MQNHILSSGVYRVLYIVIYIILYSYNLILSLNKLRGLNEGDE
jgi:hypothetical protein